MRLGLFAVPFLVLQGCSVAPRPAPLTPIPAALDLTVAYEGGAARLTLLLDHPTHVVVIEQGSNGKFEILAGATTPGPDVLASGVYRFSVAREVGTPPDIVPAPMGPCTESRPSDSGTEYVWTGFCGIASAGSARVTQELSSFPTLPSMGSAHRVLAVELPGPVDSADLALLLDSMPRWLPSEALTRRLREGLGVEHEGLAWAATGISARPWR